MSEVESGSEGVTAADVERACEVHWGPKYPTDRTWEEKCAANGRVWANEKRFWMRAALRAVFGHRLASAAKAEAQVRTQNGSRIPGLLTINEYLVEVLGTVIALVIENGILVGVQMRSAIVDDDEIVVGEPIMKVSHWSRRFARAASASPKEAER